MYFQIGCYIMYHKLRRGLLIFLNIIVEVKVTHPLEKFEGWPGSLRLRVFCNHQQTVVSGYC